MNTYLHVDTFKAAVKIQSDSKDEAILALIESVSRALDGSCSRVFYSELATRYFDGSGTAYLELRGYDLLSVTSLKVDVDNDGVYEKTLVSGTDYMLHPNNSAMKSGVQLLSRGSQIGAFPRRPAAVELVGRFGYPGSTVSVGTTGEALDDTETGLTMDSTTAVHTVHAGQTIHIDSEDMYVSAVEGNELTVARGVNGTTAAAHLTAAAVTAYRYDPIIERAALIQCARLYRDTPTGGGNTASEQFGGFSPNNLYPVVRDMIAMRRRVHAGVS